MKKTRARAADSGEEVWTHFGWACKQLGIEIITAHSPEAKRRVERNHGIYQDRLVKELRLAGSDTIAAANEFLAAGFCEQLNQKFAVTPRSRLIITARLRGYDLASIFCLEEERALSADWVVRFENLFYQLQPPRNAFGRQRKSSRAALPEWRAPLSLSSTRTALHAVAGAAATTQQSKENEAATRRRQALRAIALGLVDTSLPSSNSLV
jgi:hypothetical protein